MTTTPEAAPPVLGTSIEGGPAWIVTRDEDVRAVLADPRFVNIPVGREAAAQRERTFAALGLTPDLYPYVAASVLDLDGVDHVRLRKLVSRAFTVRRVADLRPRVERITADLLDGMSGTVDVVERYAYPLPITVICELVGVPDADRAMWHGAGQATMGAEPGAMGDAVREIVAYTHGLVERRRHDPADDLVTAMIRAQDEDGDRLSDVELVTMVLGLVMAGHQTTAHLVANAVHALLTHPDQLAALRRDPALWPGAVHELMRWCGPVQMTQPRHATADAEIGGVRIAAGDVVQVMLVSANHDPAVHADPQRLDVTRRPMRRGEGHVGFGHGAHYCLGAALARQEGEVALRMLVERFPDLALEPGELTLLPVPGMRVLAELPVRLGQPRSRSTA